MRRTSPHPHPASQQHILEWEAGWGGGGLVLRRDPDQSNRNFSSKVRWKNS